MMHAKDANVGTVVESVSNIGYRYKILRGFTPLGLITVKCLKTKKITALDPHLKVKQVSYDRTRSI